MIGYDDMLSIEHEDFMVDTLEGVTKAATLLGQTHHMELHGSGGTLYSFTDWDATQIVKGARVGEGMIKDLPIPDDIWG